MNFFMMPPNATYHGFGPTRRAASLERICIPTFTECSAGEFTIFLLLSPLYLWSLFPHDIHCIIQWN